MKTQSGKLPFKKIVKSKLAKVRFNPLWKVFVRFSIPFFEFVWLQLYHRKDRNLYLKSKFSGPGNPELNRRSMALVAADPEFVSFARWLRERIPQKLLEESKQRLVSNPAEDAFTEVLNAHLDEDAKIEILRFALSDKVLGTVLPFFQMVPRLSYAVVMHNVHRQDRPYPQGSQLWHRDGDAYKLLKLFLCLTDVDDLSGPFSAIGTDEISFHAAVPIVGYDPSKSVWQNGRHSEEYMRRFVPDAKVETLKGPSGSAAWVDTAACYHKGGFCRGKDRLLLELSFVADQSHPVAEILPSWKLDRNPEAQALASDEVRRRLLSGKESAWYIRDGKRALDNPAFLVGRRILTFNLDSPARG
ncbi:MAG: hypothetical protein AB1540_03100 [Bdellovibrionota bacterium]